MGCVDSCCVDSRFFGFQIAHRLPSYNFLRSQLRNCSTRSFYSEVKELALLTCPIFYVNARPHLGHSYTVCLADAWARYMRIRGHPLLKSFGYKESDSANLQSFNSVRTHISCGVDEHGIKVRQAAHKCNMTPKQYCDQMTPLYQSLCRTNKVEVGDFIRTTEARHRNAVEEFWNRLERSGCLYRSKYSGWYSVSDEAFYMDQDICPASRTDSVTSGSSGFVSKESGNAVEWVEEDNFVFKLTAFRAQLHKWLDSGVFPRGSEIQLSFRDLAHHYVDCAQDVSVSRPTSRLNWGIPVPGDPDQVIYVWLDALVNYLTVTNFPWSRETDSEKPLFWPPHIQFFGRDILKFHAVLWPSLLLAVELPLPQHLICHFHILADGVKMSKSKGNLVDPFEEQIALSSGNNYPHAESNPELECLRYVLLRLPLLNSDASFSHSAARQMINSELVNSIGNLLSRICSLRLNPHQSLAWLTHSEVYKLFGHSSDDAELLRSIDTLSQRFDKLWWDQVQPHLAIEQVLSTIRLTNAFLERHHPWHEDNSTSRENVIAVVAESLRLAALLLRPVVPSLSTRILQRLGLNPEIEHTIQAGYTGKLGPDRGVLLHRLL